jgi:alpha-L-fucosidase 2
MNWENNSLTSAMITSNAGGACKIRTAKPVEIKTLTIKSIKDRNGYVLSFNSEKGKNYLVTAL